MSRPFENTDRSQRLAPLPRNTSRERHRERSRRKSMVPAACLPCQRRKCKCDGSRPQCQPCAIRRLECEFDVLEGTSQKDRVKQKYEALEHKYNEVDTLLAELKYSDEDLALSLLVRLRAGEPVPEIVRSISPRSTSNPAPDEFDGDLPMGYAGGVMLGAAPTSPNLFAPSNQSPPFQTLVPDYQPLLMYPDNTLAHLDPSLGANTNPTSHGNGGLNELDDQIEMEELPGTHETRGQGL